MLRSVVFAAARAAPRGLPPGAVVVRRAFAAQAAATETPVAAAAAADGPSRFVLETYGCQMNVQDSDVVRAILLQAGLQPTEHVEEADLVLTNTCAVREHAENKVLGRIQYLHALRNKPEQRRKRKQKKMVIGVLGCMAERLKEDLLKRKEVDLVVGPDAYRDLPRLINLVRGQQEQRKVSKAVRDQRREGKEAREEDEEEEGTVEKAVNVQLSQQETYADIMPVRRTPDDLSAFVSVMRGCNNMCSFCVVPFTRGRERSRDASSVVNEISHFVRNEGVKEVVLLGQNVNSYHDKSPASLERFPEDRYETTAGFRNLFRARHGGGMRFAELLHEVASIDPELRVRFTSPHPKDFPEGLLELIADTPNICNLLHLPLQSGSTAVLERMRRGYSREAYMDLVERARSIIPGVAISTDVIAGFCGETESDHQDTVDIMRRVMYDQAYMYAYSLRERTHAAYHMEDDVSPQDKKRRLREIVGVFHTGVQARNQVCEAGRLHLVLIEREAKSSTPEAPVLTGRTDTGKRVILPDAPVLSELPGPSALQRLLGVDNVRELVPGREEREGDTMWWTAAANTLWSGMKHTDDGSTRFADHDLLETATSALSAQAAQDRLRAGDYAAVLITEVRGHTLRGVPVSRTGLVAYNAALQCMMSHGTARAAPPRVDPFPSLTLETNPFMKPRSSVLSK